MKEQRKPWELAWTAAFLEGEGTITVDVSQTSAKCRSHSLRFTPWVKADNTEPEPIYRLQSFFGGDVRCYQSKRYKKAYRWRLTSRNAVTCLEAVAPYFASKRKMRLAELLFELQLRICAFPRGGIRLTDEEILMREKIVAEVRILNNRAPFGRKGNWGKARQRLQQSGANHLPGL